MPGGSKRDSDDFTGGTLAACRTTLSFLDADQLPPAKQYSVESQWDSHVLPGIPCQFVRLRLIFLTRINGMGDGIFWVSGRISRAYAVVGIIA